MKKATCEGRGGPMCPPVRRADTQVGPYTRPTIDNRKWVVAVAFVIALTMCGAVATAQQAGKIFRIGFLDNSTSSGIAVFLEAFRQELSKLGWIDGKNITIEYRFAEQKLERLPELAAELVRLKVDLIVTSGGPTPLAAKGATTTIPIVMTTSVDPVGSGLGCQSGAAGRQCHGACQSIARAKHQKTGDTQGRSTQARPSWIPAGAGKQRITPNERAQTCSFGAENKIGGDRDSNRRQRFRSRLSNRKAEAGQWDYDNGRAQLFG